MTLLLECHLGFDQRGVDDPRRLRGAATLDGHPVDEFAADGPPLTAGVGCDNAFEAAVGLWFVADSAWRPTRGAPADDRGVTGIEYHSNTDRSIATPKQTARRDPGPSRKPRSAGTGCAH